MSVLLRFNYTRKYFIKYEEYFNLQYKHRKQNVQNVRKDATKQAFSLCSFVARERRTLIAFSFITFSFLNT